MQFMYNSAFLSLFGVMYMFRKIYCFVAIFCLLFFIIGNVAAANQDLTNDGTFSDVQNVVNQANVGSGDVIYLNNHSFTGSGSEISVNKNGITIDGSINPNKGGTGNEVSTLDAKNLSRVINIDGANDVVLKNIIFTNGNLVGSNNQFAINGAGIYNTGSNLVLDNCEITNCSITSNYVCEVNGVIYSNKKISMSNCVLKSNKACSYYTGVGNGFGVRLMVFEGSIVNCTVQNNFVFSGVAMATGISMYGSLTNRVSNVKFINNTVRTISGIAYGGAIQILGVVTNCTFNNNSAIADNNESHAGALCFKPGTKVSNCTFIGNNAYQGGATTFHADGNLDNCIFINNTAKGYGGAISTGYGESGVVLIQKISIFNSYFEGNSAPIGGAIATKGTAVNMTNSNFVSNSASKNGGAIFIMDDGINVLNSNFTNNSAREYAGAIYVNGSNVNISDSNFNNNFAEFSGAIRVYGNNVSINESKFTNNKAISKGFSKAQIGAVGIIGSNVNVTRVYFVNNSAEGDGGALGVIGDNVQVFSSEFYYNHANPFNNDLNTGLGGAIYNIGNNIVYDNVIFKYNTAVNGSAMYINGSASLNNIVFYKNQAYTYVLPISVQNIKNKYGTTVNVTVTIVGGNNIANAIHYVGTYDSISFNNVTYLFNANGNIINRTTGSNEIHPVVGAGNSKNGTLIYIDNRENTQVIKPIVIHDENGNVIFNKTLLSSIVGDVKFSLSNLNPGMYTVEAEHPEDLFYKTIKNQTKFEIEKLVDLDVNISTNKKFYELNEEVEWTITLTNHGPHSDDNCYINGIKLENIIDFSPSKGIFDATNGIWNVGKLAQNETVTLKIKTNPAKLGIVTLTVNAVNSTQDSNISNNIATESIYIQAQPIVVPVKNVNVTNPNFGDKVKYTIIVSNSGNISANVPLRDILDEGLTFIGASGKYNWNQTTRTITWNITGLHPGKNLTFYVYAIVNDYGVLNNTAIVRNNTTVRNITVPEIIPNKTVNNEIPNFGDELTYFVSLFNDAMVDAKNVVVVDYLPEGLKYINSSNNGVYNPVTRTITWIVNITAKNNLKLILTCVVEDYGKLINNVTVGDKNASVNVYVPEITPAKSVNISNPNFGDNITYTVIVTNDGVVGSRHVVVRDVLSEGLTFIKATDNYVWDEDTRTITWIVDLGESESKTFYVYATVSSYGNITNKVVVGNRTSFVDVSVPEIVPSKSVDVEVPNFGDDVTYTVSVTNGGVVDSKYVVVRDVLGEGLKFVSASHNGMYEEVTRCITWIVDLNAGETLVFTVKANVIGYGNINNTVIVGNKSVIKNITVPEIIPNKTVNVSNPNFGDNIIYTITVFNNAVVDAKNVVVVDYLPEGLKYVNSSNNGVYNPVTRSITWIVNITAKNNLKLILTCVVETYGKLINNVAVGGNNDSVDVIVPEIVPNKTVNTENPNFGDNVTYTVTITNDGINNAKNVIVRDMLGEGLIFIKATGNYVWDEATRTITWIVDLDKKETKMFYVYSTVLGYGIIPNNLTIGNKNSVVNIIVPEIIPNKTVNIKNPILGDNVTYAVNVNNVGKVNATNVVVKDVLPERLKFISASNGGVYNPITHTITWIINITANSSVELTVNVNVTKLGNITNNVTVGNRTANCTIESEEIVDLEITIIADKSTISVGDIIIYTVTVINNGPNDAINDIVDMIMPNTLNILSYNATKGTFNMTSSQWYIGNLTKDEKITLTFVAKTLNKGNLTVNVNVTSKTFEKILKNNYDNVTIEIHENQTLNNPNKPLNPVHKIDSNNQKISENNHNSERISLPNTGNPLMIMILCILSVLFVGFRKIKL